MVGVEAISRSKRGYNEFDPDSPTVPESPEIERKIDELDRILENKRYEDSVSDPELDSRLDELSAGVRGPAVFSGGMLKPSQEEFYKRVSYPDPMEPDQLVRYRHRSEADYGEALENLEDGTFELLEPEDSYEEQLLVTDGGILEMPEEREELVFPESHEERDPGYTPGDGEPANDYQTRRNLR